MKVETKKLTLADELRETGTELGRRAAAALEAKDAALRLVEYVASETAHIHRPLARTESVETRTIARNNVREAIEQARAALRAGEAK